jgi:periplasmic protein TonB
MDPVNESRSLPSTLAIAASFVLVCGGLLLLTSTAPWTSRPVAPSEAPVAAAANTDRAAPASNPSPPANAETAATDHGDITESAEAEPQQAAPEPAETNHFASSFAQAEAAVATSGVHTIETPDETADAAHVDETQASAADVSDDVSEVDAPEVEAAAAEATAAESMHVSDAEPTAEDTLVPGAATETASVDAETAETPHAVETAAAEPDRIGAMLPESPPGAIATETIAEHDANAATPSVEATSAATIEALRAEKAEAPVSAPAQATQESTSGAGPQESRAETAAAAPLPAPPPLPTRKPEIQTARAAPQPEPAPSRKEKQAEARPAVAQAQPAQTGAGLGRWLPMALAPADKPVAKEPQRLTGQAYSSKVWAALARRKPRAGQSGSATVVFSIGMGGALNSVSIGRSSGNARIDQLALATVRGAAPFPPPPSGPASFSIRIDFH